MNSYGFTSSTTRAPTFENAVDKVDKLDKTNRVESGRGKAIALRLQPSPGTECLHTLDAHRKRGKEAMPNCLHLAC